MSKNPSFTRNMTDKFVIKGALSDDGTTITYINEDKEQMDISVARCFKNFCGENIELTIAVKMNQDLGSGDYEEE